MINDCAILNRGRYIRVPKSGLQAAEWWATESSSHSFASHSLAPSFGNIDNSLFILTHEGPKAKH
jgi:hypothetical protein